MHLVRIAQSIAKSARPASGHGVRGPVALCLCLFPVAVNAQPFELVEPIILDTASHAFFNVEVNGTPEDATDPQQEARRFGKAFAVGDNMLVTSLHVVGSDAEWAPARTTRDEITRAVRPVKRTVQLSKANGSAQPFTDVVVLPAPTHAIDAAGILAPDLALGDYFQLSMCDIVKDKVYYALMTQSNPPTERNSVGNVTLAPVIADGYLPASYGPLYVFHPDGQPDFASEPWGHDGSPIFDDDGAVVAVVSAVTVTGGGTKVLATPIQPLFPGTNQLLARAPEPSLHGNSQLKCSMADVVRRIHDQVASHAIWTVIPEQRDGRPTGNILFEYESVADPPNIASIRVEYQFWGPEKKGKETTRIAHRRGDLDVITLTPTGLGRTFETSEIVGVGRALAEPYVKGGNGSIVYLRLTITPTLDTGETLENRSKTYEVPWSAFQ